MLFVYMYCPLSDHQGHAQEMMKTLNLADYYGVVIVSGDGLVYEVRYVGNHANRRQVQQHQQWKIFIAPPCARNYEGNECKYCVYII